MADVWKSPTREITSGYTPDVGEGSPGWDAEETEHFCAWNTVKHTEVSGPSFGLAFVALVSAQDIFNEAVEAVSTVITDLSLQWLWSARAQDRNSGYWKYSCREYSAWRLLPSQTLFKPSWSYVSVRKSWRNFLRGRFVFSTENTKTDKFVAQLVALQFWAGLCFWIATDDECNSRGCCQTLI